jgi:SAM-dependent methyltransferase
MKNLVSEAAKSAAREAELAKYDRHYFFSEYWKEDLPGQSGNRGLSYMDPGHVQRFQLLAGAISRMGPFKSLLDAGCGTGGLLQALERVSEAELFGVDSSTHGISLAREQLIVASKIQVLRAELRSLPFPDCRFDLLACLDVLEHLPIFDIEDCLSEIFRVCNNTLILSINSDNPYLYHPTILSKGTWRAIFDAREGWSRNENFEDLLVQHVCSKRAEYDFYCYSRIR